MQSNLKKEIYDVITGKSTVRFGATIQTITNYLGKSASAGSAIKDSKQVREEEAEKLKSFITKNNLWINPIDFSLYVSEGAEQRVYLKDSRHVLKLNDAIYYKKWIDYFHSLLLHNYFFSDTAYELIGFTKENGVLYAVVQQAFVNTTQTTNLNQVKVFLEENGFQNNRNNDYINHALGIILEDLHDENVLTQNDMLYFIDTVFYFSDSFWKN